MNGTAAALTVKDQTDVAAYPANQKRRAAGGRLRGRSAVCGNPTPRREALRQILGKRVMDLRVFLFGGYCDRHDLPGEGWSECATIRSFTIRSTRLTCRPKYSV